jgi:apoptosis-inducing factor 2
VNTNKKTLRVDAAGPRVYAIGDAGNYSRGAIHLIYEAVPVVATNLQRDLQAYTSASDENLNKPKGPDREFKEDTSETQFVPVGRSKGVAAVMGWRVPSFLVWLMKGRDFLLWSVPSIATGDKWNSESKWKPT